MVELQTIVNSVTGFLMNHETVLCEMLLFFVATLGDQALVLFKADNLLFRAGVDSITHGLVGFLSWAIVIRLTSFGLAQISQCSLCMFLAMIVDIDHFFAAKSFRLQDAVSLPFRPFFHQTTIIVPLSACLWSIGEILQNNKYTVLCHIFIVAWLSHHIRDGTRRGIALPPFGSSPPIPYVMYMLIILLLPLFYRYLLITKDITDHTVLQDKLQTV